jgi:hypothetical protein
VPQHRLIATGPTPSGRTWKITGRVKSNGSCSRWLLTISASPYGEAPGSWSVGQDIPARGTLHPDFISAHDEGGSSSRAFSGVVGSGIRKIELLFGAHHRQVVVQPFRPPLSVRRHAPWLRDLRFFVEFLPGVPAARAAKLIGPTGKVVSIQRPLEGEFESSG